VTAQIVQLDGRGSSWSIPTYEIFPWPVLDDRGRAQLALKRIQSKYNEAKTTGLRKLQLMSSDASRQEKAELESLLRSVDRCYSEAQRIRNGPLPVSTIASRLESKVLRVIPARSARSLAENRYTEILTPRIEMVNHRDVTARACMSVFPRGILLGVRWVGTPKRGST